MSKTFTLDDIRTAAEKNYGSLIIELGDGHKVELRNVMRLSDAERDEFMALSDREDDDDVNVREALASMLRIVAATEGQANKLEEAFGEDLTLYAQTVELYKDATQAGEASPSES